jgi:hypothetical protein
MTFSTIKIKNRVPNTELPRPSPANIPPNKLIKSAGKNTTSHTQNPTIFTLIY